MKLRKRNVNEQNLSPFGPDSVVVGARDLQFGNDWCSSFAVTGYPREVRPGWLEPLVTHPAAADISIHIEPTPALIAADRLRRQLAKLESSRRLDATKGRLADPVIEVAAADARGLADRLARGEGRLFRMGLYITVRGVDKEDLEQRVADMRSVVASLLVEMRPTTFRQLQGWTTTLPIGIDSVGITRTFDTDALAASYPFVASEFSHPQGVFYGRNMRGSGLVFWDRFQQKNHNATILACSGSGKSYLAKLEILRSLYRGIDVLVVDPEDEYRPLSDAVGGVHLSLGSPGVCLNPFDLGTEEDALSRRALFIHGFVSTLLGTELDSDAKAVLDRAIVHAYEQVGITSDTRTHSRQAPTMADLHSVLQSMSEPAATHLASRLEPFVTGSYRNIFSGSTSVRPSSHLVVFSLRHLPDETKAAATMVVLDYIWRTVSDDSRVKRRMVAVDEAWLLMRDPAGAKFLFRLAKSARKYWCGLTVITQDGADLLATELGQAVIANSATQVLMGQSTQTIDAISNSFRLSSGERSFLLAAEQGEAILLAGSQRVAFKTVASDDEHRLATSSPVETAGVA